MQGDSHLTYIMLLLRDFAPGLGLLERDPRRRQLFQARRTWRPRYVLRRLRSIPVRTSLFFPSKKKHTQTGWG